MKLSLTLALALISSSLFAETLNLDYVPTTDVGKAIQKINSPTSIAKGDVITIDTRDQESCLHVVEKLTIDKSNCEFDPARPLLSLVHLRNSNPNEFETQVKLKNLTPKEKSLMSTMRNVGAMGVGMIGVIYALPESISKWDREKLSQGNVFDKYLDNLDKGPVIDGDDWTVNYIGHPISGAAYYTIVRHQGFSPLESFGYAVFMSSFFWEYGLEAFAEIPSIQDLFITPIVGSLMGEAFYQMSKKIEDNDGQLFGSRRAGNIATVILNPAGALSNQINKALDYPLIKKSQFTITTGNGTSRFNQATGNTTPSNYVTFSLKMQY